MHRVKTAVLTDEKGQWIDALAVRDDGAVAWAAGKTVRARSAKGEVKSLVAASTVRGLAFAPKGYRLALAHYNGASLWFPNTAEPPETLTWKGSHLDVTWSPDGRFLVTSMQENSHAWLAAGRRRQHAHVRLSGEAAVPVLVAGRPLARDLGRRGLRGLAVREQDGTDGQTAARMRHSPDQGDPGRLSSKGLVIALGYDDGFVLLCRLTDGSELPVRLEDKAGGAMSALVWDDKGQRLLFGTRNGQAGLLTLPA